MRDLELREERIMDSGRCLGTGQEHWVRTPVIRGRNRAKVKNTSS